MAMTYITRSAGKGAPGMLLAFILVGYATTATADLSATAEFSIAPQPLQGAVVRYTEQSGVQITSSAELIKGRRSPGVTGSLPAKAALTKLLAGTDLAYDVVDQNTVALRPASMPVARDEPAGGNTNGHVRLAQSEALPGSGPPAAESNPGERTDEENAGRESTLRGGIPEVLVTGSKILNMDIPRTRDDPQPYVVFDREKIELSGATNIEEFLKNNLPMNSIAGTNAQVQQTGFAGNISQVNLRGLGTNQTLILVDGRRMANVFTGDSVQPDINGIPLSAIERIEVLPATASGIYGGGATGGVINIIMRRDYAGLETKLTYDNTFDTDSAQRRVDLAYGFNIEGGRTNVLLTGTYFDSNEILLADRDFLQRGRAAILANTGGNYRALETGGVRPPFGALPNIRSATGANLTLDDGTPLNSPITFAPEGYAGAASDQGVALVANAGRYDVGVTGGSSGGSSGGTPATQQARLESASATIRRQFTPKLEAFIGASASNNIATSHIGTAISNGITSRLRVPASAPTNPFQQDILVSVPNNRSDVGEQFIRSLVRRGDVGLIAKLPAEWMGGLDYTWSRSSYAIDSFGSLFTTDVDLPVQTGVFDLLRDPVANPIDFSPYLDPASQARTLRPFRSTLQDTTLRFGGPIGRLPGGRPTVSVAVEYRDEATAENVMGQFGLRFVFPSRSQTVKSVYAEIRAPLFSAANAVRGIEALELQVSGRRDDYETHGVTGLVLDPTPETVISTSTNKVSSTDPTVALRYQPIQDLVLRASWGTGFLPPSVQQIQSVPPFPGDLCSGFDPLRGNTEASFDCIGGGNPDLRPENSRNWSAGVILTPRFVPGLRLSVDYTSVEKSDNISSPPNLADMIQFFPERVTRGPRLPDDPPEWAGPVIFFDGTLINVASATVDAYDVQLDYQLETAVGSFDFFTVATWQTEFTQQFLPNSPLVDNLGVVGNPLKFKANGGLTWSARQWRAGWTSRYFDSYWLNSAHTVVLNQGSDKVDSQIYHDVFATYRFDAPGNAGARASHWLGGTEVTLGVRNLFNTRPPVDTSTSRYYSQYGDPRLASYYLSLSKSFN